MVCFGKRPGTATIGESMNTRSLMLLIVCLTLVAVFATGALAKNVATATRVEDVSPEIGLAVPPPQVVGNLNAPSWLLGGWFTGLESYAVVFEPASQVSCAAMGFTPTMAHQYLDFEAADVPVTFTVAAGLGSAVWDPVAGCYVPGSIDCQGAAYDVTIDTAGTYDIAIPIACECAYVADAQGNPFRYYLSMTYLTEFTARVVTDGVQATCTSFNDWGEGWTDLEPFFTTYGSVNVWADAECCANPVSVETETWGGIKSLYR